VVSSSTDGGRTWSPPNLVAFNDTANFFNDKEWITAGTGGRVVVTWTRFNSGAHGAGYIDSPIVGAISYDRGHTWNRQGFPVSDKAHPYDQGSQVGFAPNGDLLVAYEGGAPSTGYQTSALVFARSRDDGMTFTNTELARVYDDLDCYPVFAGSQTLSNQHFRMNSFPSMSIDPTTGSVALVWNDDQGAGTCGGGGTSFTGTTSNQVKLVTGNGTTFGAPVRITSGTADKVFPSVAARGGKIAVDYYTAGYANTNPACYVKIPDSATSPGPFWESSATSVCLDFAARLSTDGFAAERRLTSEGSNPYVQFANGSFIGDYTEIAIGSDGTAHASWTDFRGRPGTNGPNQDVYVSAIR
jgi:hypothetical protein